MKKAEIRPNLHRIPSASGIINTGTCGSGVERQKIKNGKLVESLLRRHSKSRYLPHCPSLPQQITGRVFSGYSRKEGCLDLGGHRHKWRQGTGMKTAHWVSMYRMKVKNHPLPLSPLSTQKASSQSFMPPENSLEVFSGKSDQLKRPWDIDTKGSQTKEPT